MSTIHQNYKISSSLFKHAISAGFQTKRTQHPFVCYLRYKRYRLFIIYLCSYADIHSLQKFCFLTTYSFKLYHFPVLSPYTRTNKVVYELWALYMQVCHFRCHLCQTLSYYSLQFCKVANTHSLMTSCSLDYMRQ